MRLDPKKVVKALKRNGGKVRKTARELGVSSGTVLLRTDEEEFFFFQMKPPVDEIDLNHQYQEYLRYFNNERLDLGIGIITPAEKARNSIVGTFIEARPL